MSLRFEPEERRAAPRQRAAAPPVGAGFSLGSLGLHKLSLNAPSRPVGPMPTEAGPASDDDSDEDRPLVERLAPPASRPPEAKDKRRAPGAWDWAYVKSRFGQTAIERVRAKERRWRAEIRRRTGRDPHRAGDGQYEKWEDEVAEEIWNERMRQAQRSAAAAAPQRPKIRRDDSPEEEGEIAQTAPARKRADSNPCRPLAERDYQLNPGLEDAAWEQSKITPYELTQTQNRRMDVVQWFKTRPTDPHELAAWNGIADSLSKRFDPIESMFRQDEYSSAYEFVRTKNLDAARHGMRNDPEGWYKFLMHAFGAYVEVAPNWSTEAEVVAISWIIRRGICIYEKWGVPGRHVGFKHPRAADAPLLLWKARKGSSSTEYVYRNITKKQTAPPAAAMAVDPPQQQPAERRA